MEFKKYLILLLSLFLLVACSKKQEEKEAIIDLTPIEITEETNEFESEWKEQNRNLTEFEIDLFNEAMENFESSTDLNPVKMLAIQDFNGVSYKILCESEDLGKREVVIFKGEDEKPVVSDIQIYKEN